jgi:hypothetical protein
MSARASLFRSRIRSRTTTVLVLIAAHSLLLWALWRDRTPHPDEPEAFTSVLFFLPGSSNSAIGSAPPEATRAPRPIIRAPHLPLMPLPHPAASGTAITVPLTPGARVDWYAQIPDAADSELDIEQRALSRRNALTRKYLVPDDARNPHPHAASSFRWYEAGIHRIDTRGPIPVLHLNDRCVLIGFVFPLCLIGHIETHGDLFDHMTAEQDDKVGTSRPNDAP